MALLMLCCGSYSNLEKYGKGVRFADQALNLDPECCKAHMRKGMEKQITNCFD